MLVRTSPHHGKSTRFRARLEQGCWCFRGVRADAFAVSGDRRRADIASHKADLQILIDFGARVELDFALRPEREHQRLEVYLKVTFDLDRVDRTLARSLLRRFESTCSRLHDLSRCRPKGLPPEMLAGSHSAGITSTIELSDLQPVPGRFTAGRPLQVRSAIDWPMILAALADLADPVVIRFGSSTANPQALQRHLDEARRRWQVRQDLDRRTSRERRASVNVAGDLQRQRHRPEPLTSASRWQTPALEALASMAGPPRHLDIRVNGSDPGTVMSLAGVLQAAIYEPGTARVRLPEPDVTNAASVAGIGSSHPSDLLSMAGTLCDMDGVANAMAGPQCDSPLMYPAISTSINPPVRDSLVIGHRYDELTEQETDLTVKLELGDLCRHVFITGATGFGKTVGVFQMIAEAARANPPIPVTYITLAKNEATSLLGWRKSTDPCLKAYAEQMLFYGLHSKAPLRVSINPFALDNATPDQRAEHAVNTVKVSIPLEGPLEANTIEACGDLSYAMEHDGRVPILADLVDAVNRVLQDKDYTSDVMRDVFGAFTSRIAKLTSGSSGALFRSPRPLPAIEQLFSRPHCISCAGVPIEVKAIYVIDLLLRLEHYLLQHPVQGGSHSALPKLWLIIDEAQVIAPRDPRPAGGGGPTTSIEAAAVLAHCVKTLRALGVSIVFASQHPLSVDAELVKAPGTHLVLAQRQADERAELAGLIGLDARQCEQLNGLAPGHGYLRSPGMKRPHRVVVPYIAGIHDCQTLDDEALAEQCAKSTHHRALAIERCDGELSMRESRLTHELKRLGRDCRRLKDLRHASELAQVDTTKPDTARRLLAEVRSMAAKVERDLQSRGQSFERQWVRTLKPPPAWLTGWADSSRRSTKQQQTIAVLRKRHHRLERAYARRGDRFARALDQTRALTDA